MALKRNQISQRCLVGLDVWSHHKLIKNAWLSFQLWLLVNCFSICHHLREFESWYLRGSSLYSIYTSLHEHRFTCLLFSCSSCQSSTSVSRKGRTKDFDALMMLWWLSASVFGALTHPTVTQLCVDWQTFIQLCFLIRPASYWSVWFCLPKQKKKDFLLCLLALQTSQDLQVVKRFGRAMIVIKNMKL